MSLILYTEAICARGETLTRLLDYHVQKALCARHPLIARLLPQDANTIFLEYVIPIDEECTEELKDHMSRLSGDVNVAFDGVTVNGKSKMVYTVSKNEFSWFFTFTDLEEYKHVTDAEVNDALAVIGNIKNVFRGTRIASLPVDNAGHHVALKVAEGLRLQNEFVLVNRDPSHCVDLLSKDCAKTTAMKDVLSIARDIAGLGKTDRIDSIRKKMIKSGRLHEKTTIKMFCDTRMNTIHSFVESVGLQKGFFSLIQGDEDFKKYFNERKKADKTKLESILGNCNYSNWTMFDISCAFTAPFVRVQNLCSRKDLPLSMYLLLVQAMKNELCAAVSESARFDTFMGEGAAKELLDMVLPRFNMNVLPTAMRKVGLLDEHHIWCYICDPFSHLWRYKFCVEGNVPLHVKNMIAFYVPETEVDYQETRHRIRKEYNVSLSCFIMFYLYTRNTLT